MDGSIAAESMAYRSLRETMNHIQQTYTSLNPCDGIIGGPGGLQGNDHILTEFVRGGIVRAWVVWEAFLGDLVKEAFDLAICISSSAHSAHQEQLGLLIENWPVSRTILRTRIGQHMKTKTTQRGRFEGPDQDTSESGKTKVAPEVIALNLLLEKDCWKKLLWEFMTSEVNKMSPVFVGDAGINNTFSTLFHKKMCVSQDVVEYVHHVCTTRDGEMFEFNGMSYHYQLRTRGVNIIIKEVQGLHNILRLYYGLRCAFTHGSIDKTLNYGALSNFPETAEGIKIVGTDGVGGPVNEDVAASLSNLYYKVRTFGKDAVVYYADLLNMIRFLKLCARMLLYVIARWIYNTFNMPVWNYNPTKDRNCRSGSETRNKE